MSNSLLFTAQIVNSEKFTKYRRIRYSLYWTLLILYGISIRPRRNRFADEVEPSVSDHLGIDFGLLLLLFVIIGFIAIGIHEYSRSVEPLGTLRFYPQAVSIKMKDSVETTHSYAEVKDMIIRRRSTWQHENRKSNYLVKFGNLLIFRLNSNSHKYEFVISSADHNEKFVAMINNLKSRGIDFLYTTV